MTGVGWARVVCQCTRPVGPGRSRGGRRCCGSASGSGGWRRHGPSLHRHRGNTPQRSRGWSEGLGFGLRIRSGFRVEGSGTWATQRSKGWFRVRSLGLRVWGAGFRYMGSTTQHSREWSEGLHRTSQHSIWSVGVSTPNRQPPFLCFTDAGICYKARPRTVRIMSRTQNNDATGPPLRATHRLPTPPSASGTGAVAQDRHKKSAVSDCRCDV